MDFSEQTIQTYVKDLSSKAPVPGGGGVAALTGALAAGLAAMVCSLTVGKKKYADVEEEIQTTAAELQGRIDTFYQCMESDAIAFEPLSRAYSLPKDTEEQRQYKEEEMERCLHGAAEPPLAICRTVAELVPLIQTVAEKGSTLAVSDAGCAASLAMAAFRAASLNVYINTRLMKDRAFAEQLNELVHGMEEQTLPALGRLYDTVKDKLCK